MSAVTKPISQIFSAVGSLFGGEQAPAAAPPPPPPPPPAAPVAPPVSQAAAQPDQAAQRTEQTRRGVPGAGASSTMLTGAGGIDPRLLSLGKNTLLGA